MDKYLKMADCFDMPISVTETNSGRYAMVQKSGRVIDAKFLCDAEIECVSHAINSHDEIVAEVERLRARVYELEEFTYHFCDNSYNVDLGGGDCTATTCEAKEMAHKLDNRAWPNLW